MGKWAISGIMKDTSFKKKNGFPDIFSICTSAGFFYMMDIDYRFQTHMSTIFLKGRENL